MFNNKNKIRENISYVLKKKRKTDIKEREKQKDRK